MCWFSLCFHFWYCCQDIRLTHTGLLEYVVVKLDEKKYKTRKTVWIRCASINWPTVNLTRALGWCFNHVISRQSCCSTTSPGQSDNNNVSWRSKNLLFHREGKERTTLPCCSKQRCHSGILCMIIVMQRWGQKAELQLYSNHNNSDDSDSPVKDNSQTNQDSAPNTIERLEIYVADIHIRGIASNTCRLTHAAIQHNHNQNDFQYIGSYF